MTHEQRAALKIIEADILFEANANSYDEYVNVEGATMARRPGGTLVATDTGQYTLEVRKNEDDTLLATLITDYGFCKASTDYAVIETDGQIEFL